MSGAGEDPLVVGGDGLPGMPPANPMQPLPPMPPSQPAAPQPPVAPPVAPAQPAAPEAPVMPQAPVAPPAAPPVAPTMPPAEPAAPVAPVMPEPAVPAPDFPAPEPVAPAAPVMPEPPAPFPATEPVAPAMPPATPEAPASFPTPEPVMPPAAPPVVPTMPPAEPAAPVAPVMPEPAVPAPDFPAPEPVAPAMPQVEPVAPAMPPVEPVAPSPFPAPTPVAPAGPPADPVMPETPASFPPAEPAIPPAAPMPPAAPVMPETPASFPPAEPVMPPAAPMPPVAPVMPPAEPVAPAAPIVPETPAPFPPAEPVMPPVAPVMPQAPVDPMGAVPAVQPAAAPTGSAPVVQDVLVAVAAHEGTEGAEDLARNVALSDLRTAAKMQREGGRRTQKNTRKKSDAPKFIRVATRFHPGRPLVAAFASPKGGVAKSTTSANFAAYIAKAAELSGMGDKVRVLLVDGDVANGNMALRLAHTLTPNMLDMVNHMDELAAHGQKMDNWQRDVSPFVLAHPKLPNMDILAAPDNPDVITQLRQEDLDSMMRAWAQFYQVVVFDCGTQITEFTNCAWLNYSSQVYLMVEPELACLNSTSEFVKRARKGQLITPDVCRIICVRADMDIGDLNTQQAVGDVFSFIPPQRQFYWPDFHRDAIEAGNSGELLTLDSAAYAEALTPVVKGALEVYEQDFNPMR